MLFAQHIGTIPTSAVLKHKHQEAASGITGGHQNIVDSFELLLRLNRFNNQMFFLNGFGHAFNNSINSIQLGSTLLNHYVQDISTLVHDFGDEPERLSPEFKKKCCDILSSIPQVIQGITDSTRKLGQFASHLTEIAGQNPDTARVPVEINSIITLCSAMMQHQIASYTNYFHIELDESSTAVYGSAGLIAQVVLNLMMNSLLSLPDRSCAVVISTSCNHDSGQIVVSVRDEGAGISDAILPQVVDPFFTTWQKYGCVGLGLTITDRVVRILGGKLSIDSDVGKGTHVSVMMPLYRHAESGSQYA